MVLIQIAGYLLIGVGIWQAIQMSWLDRQMQRHRVPDGPLAAYFFVPIRWQRRLYTAEGQALVGKAWRTMLRMYAFAIAGMLLLAIASPSN